MRDNTPTRPSGSPLSGHHCIIVDGGPAGLTCWTYFARFKCNAPEAGGGCEVGLSANGRTFLSGLLLNRPLGRRKDCIPSTASTEESLC